MSFGNNFLKGFFGNDYLKDYTHASKTFRDGGYELAPRLKFLYYTRFNLNTTGIPRLNEILSKNDVSDIGLMAKSVDLPQFSFDVDIQNQYNRKRLVQTGVNYDPVTIRLHDDGSDLIRQMWYNYFSYYYKDPTKGYRDVPAFNGSSGSLGNQSTDKGLYNERDTYLPFTEQNDWGYIGESYTDGTGAVPSGGKPRFFNDITIYGFNQHNFVAYVLINPLITSFNHDTYNYTESGGTMENRMIIRYESVKYYSGVLSGTYPDQNAHGFADPSRYDTEASPLTRPGAQSILGVGGLIDQIAGTITDLQAGDIIGAVQRAGATYGTFKDKNLQSIIRNEGRAVLQDIIRNPGQNADFFFPKSPGQNGPTAGQTNEPKRSSATAFNTPPRGNL